MVILTVRGHLRRHSLSGTLQSRLALYTYITSWRRNVMRPQICCDAYIGSCTSTTSTSLAVTPT